MLHLDAPSSSTAPPTQPTHPTLSSAIPPVLTAVSFVDHLGMTISSGASAVQDTHSAEPPPFVADALTAAARRVATGSPTTDLVGTAASAVAAVRAAGAAAAVAPVSASTSIGPTSTDSDFLAAAALAVAVGRADARAGASCTVAMGVAPAATDRPLLDTSVRDTHAAFTAAAAAVGRKAAEGSVAAVRRACTGVAAAAVRARMTGGHSGTVNGSCSVASSARLRAASDRDSLEATMHIEVDVRMEHDRNRAVAPTRSYLSHVPVQLLRSEETTRETLQHSCRERGLPFGVADSEASLEASLVRCNAQNRMTWGARMMFMANYVRGQAEESRGDVKGFQLAMLHPAGVGVDQPPEIANAGLPVAPSATLEHRAATLCSPYTYLTPSLARPPHCPPAQIWARLAPDGTPTVESTQSGPASQLTPSHDAAPLALSFETPVLLMSQTRRGHGLLLHFFLSLPGSPPRQPSCYRRPTTPPS